MREATPYVTKGSPVSEIGWETPPPESPRLGASAPDPLASQPPQSFHRDRRSIPLRMCFVTRSLALADPESRYERELRPDRAARVYQARLPPLSSAVSLGRKLCVQLSALGVPLPDAGPVSQVLSLSFGFCEMEIIEIPTSLSYED